MLDVMCPYGFPYPTPKHNSGYGCGGINSGTGGSIGGGGGGGGGPISDGGAGIM